MLAGEFDSCHPLRLWARPRRVLPVAIKGPDDEPDTSQAAKTVRTAEDRCHHFDPIIRCDLDCLWSGRNQPGTPAPVGSNNRPGSVGSSGAPIMTGEHLYESCPPGLESGLLQLLWRVCPVDLANYYEIARVDVYAFQPSEVRKV